MSSPPDASVAEAVAAILADVRVRGDEAVREYSSPVGTNHILPTAGAANYTGGLWAGKFLKTVTHQEVRSPASSAAIGKVCGRQCRLEGFEAHARSADARVTKYAGKD